MCNKSRKRSRHLYDSDSDSEYDDSFMEPSNKRQRLMNNNNNNNRNNTNRNSVHYDSSENSPSQINNNTNSIPYHPPTINPIRPQAAPQIVNSIPYTPPTINPIRPQVAPQIPLYAMSLYEDESDDEDNNLTDSEDASVNTGVWNNQIAAQSWVNESSSPDNELQDAIEESLSYEQPSFHGAPYSDTELQKVKEIKKTRQHLANAIKSDQLQNFMNVKKKLDIGNNPDWMHFLKIKVVPTDALNEIPEHEQADIYGCKDCLELIGTDDDFDTQEEKDINRAYVEIPSCKAKYKCKLCMNCVFGRALDRNNLTDPSCDKFICCMGNEHGTFYEQVCKQNRGWGQYLFDSIKNKFTSALSYIY